MSALGLRKFKDKITFPDVMDTNWDVDFRLDHTHKAIMEGQEVTMAIEANCNCLNFGGSRSENLYILAFDVVTGKSTLTAPSTNETEEGILDGLNLFMYIKSDQADGWAFMGEIPIDPPIINITNCENAEAKAWILANTEGVTLPLAEIAYNGETIAQLNAGDKATIPCSQYTMSKDLVVKVNGGNCSGEHIIEVDALPAVGEEGAIYKTFDAMEIIVKDEGITLPLLALYKALDQVAELYAVSTKSTTNIKVSTDTEYYFYYVISENNIFLYKDGAWVTFAEFLGGDIPVHFGGFIDSAEAAELTTYGYYILGMYVYCEYSNGEWVRYLAPSGSLTVTENGTHDVTYQKEVIVNVPALIKVDALPTKNIDTNSAYLYQDPPFKDIYTFNRSLKGTWEWNPTISTGTGELDGLISGSTPFESNGETFSDIRIERADSTNEFCHITYGGKRVYTATSKTSGTWLDENYRTLTFANAVSWDELSNFLIANGRKTTNLWVAHYELNYYQKQITTNGVHDVSRYAEVIVDVAGGSAEIPEGYIKPEGALVITSNGVYDVTDKVGVSVNVPIPEGYIKPEGELTIDRNNKTYDVTEYATIKVNTANPYEVSSESFMNTLVNELVGSTIGGVYKYVGTTTDTYENGALYILEEVS